MAAPTVDGFETTSFEALGAIRTVYRRGDGPAVVVMHEIPGITPEVAGFARRVADAGFSVAMPWMFGTPNRPLSTGYMLGQLSRACISREFRVLARREASPITEWLRALCRQLHEETGGPVGAIGMCITGNFALALAVDEHLMAPVLSQPSLPFGVTAAHRADLHVRPEQLAEVKRRVSDEGLRVLGMRFTHDPLCPPERFRALREELGDGFEAIEIDSGPANAHGIGRRAHSVVTVDLVDEEGHPTRAALERVLSFFEERLLDRQ